VKLAISVLIFVAMLVVCASYALAQTPVDPSGHWEGTVTAPFGEVAIEVDLRRNERGQLTGTFTQPGQNLTGLPFGQVVLDGRLLTLKLTGGTQLTGTLFSDGKSYSGDFSIPQGTAPFTMARTGDARVAAPVTSPAVGRDIEGHWAGTLDVNGRQLRLVLTVANQPDGTAISKVLSLDEGGIEVPVIVAQQNRDVTMRVPMNGATFAAALAADGTALAGTYALQDVSFPLTLRREK
jgi:hypothetical protein